MNPYIPLPLEAEVHQPLQYTPRKLRYMNPDNTPPGSRGKLLDLAARGGFRQDGMEKRTNFATFFTTGAEVETTGGGELGAEG